MSKTKIPISRNLERPAEGEQSQLKQVILDGPLADRALNRRIKEPSGWQRNPNRIMITTHQLPNREDEERRAKELLIASRRSKKKKKK